MPLPTDNDPSAVGSGVGTSQVLTGYQLGPFAAGAASPLGQFFGWLNGLSTDYAAGLGQASTDFGTGLTLVANNPQAAGYVLRADTEQQYTPAQIAAIKDAETKGLSSNPINAVGQILGGVFGTGVQTIGQATGVAGGTAAFGVSQGVQQGVSGVTQVGAAGVSGGFAGAIQGLGSGISTTLGANAANAGLIFVAVVVLVIILASA